MKLGQKSKDGAHTWNRETLCALHSEGKTDAQIADLFGCPDAFVTFGRKRESFWENVEVAEPTEAKEEAKANVKTKKKDTES